MPSLRHPTLARRLFRALRTLGPLGVAATPLFGLVRWNDSREQIYLNVGANASWESNIFATAGGDGDIVYGFNVGADYQRRAGLIAINASADLASAQFAEYSRENYLNPNLSIELNKDTGRTTGSYTLHAQRESRADPAANLRTEAWNYNTGLNLKYPVIERYALAGSFGASLRDFDDNRILVDLTSYTASVDLFYVYTSERDLVGGYNFRQSESSSGTIFRDHGFTAGISGKILPKVSGVVRAGYQLRTASDELIARTGGESSSWTMSAAATWTLNRRLTVTSSLSKDFSVTSTDVSVNTFNATLDAQMSISSKLSAFAGLVYGSNDFLGEAGGGRHDTTGGFNVGLGRTFFNNVKGTVTYSYSQNWSTAELSDFERQSVSVNVSTRL